jgi:heme oxygenase
LSLLNDATRLHHAEADAPWLALMTTDVRHLEYARQLEITYGFEAPLEGALAYTDGLAAILDVRTRARAGLIAQDLLALGVAPSRLSRLPHCFAITPFQAPADALGWMYFVERSTLLHDSVRHNLVQRLPGVRRATTYLDAACSSAPGARWQQFGHALAKYAATDAVTERVVSAADQAFRKWRDWNHPAQRSAG